MKIGVLDSHNGRPYDRPSSRIESHAVAMNSIKSQNSTLSEFVKSSEKCFYYEDWTVDYGGTPWGRICSGWLRLYNSTSKEQIWVAIDHIYDLQHNSDSVFNKVERYLKNGNVKWLANALELKAHIKDIHVLSKLCSSDMKRLAKRVLSNLKIKASGSEILSSEELFEFLKSELSKKHQIYFSTDGSVKMKVNEYTGIKLLKFDNSPKMSLLVYPYNEDTAKDKETIRYNFFSLIIGVDDRRSYYFVNILGDKRPTPFDSNTDLLKFVEDKIELMFLYTNNV